MRSLQLSRRLPRQPVAPAGQYSPVDVPLVGYVFDAGDFLRARGITCVQWLAMTREQRQFVITGNRSGVIGVAGSILAIDRHCIAAETARIRAEQVSVPQPRGIPTMQPGDWGSKQQLMADEFASAPQPKQQLVSQPQTIAPAPQPKQELVPQPQTVAPAPAPDPLSYAKPAGAAVSFPQGPAIPAYALQPTVQFIPVEQPKAVPPQPTVQPFTYAKPAGQTADQFSTIDAFLGELPGYTEFILREAQVSPSDASMQQLAALRVLLEQGLRDLQSVPGHTMATAEQEAIRVRRVVAIRAVLEVVMRMQADSNRGIVTALQFAGTVTVIGIVGGMIWWLTRKPKRRNLTRRRRVVH